jgi:hypothetical protein
MILQRKLVNTTCCDPAACNATQCAASRISNNPTHDATARAVLFVRMKRLREPRPNLGTFLLRAPLVIITVVRLSARGDTEKKNRIRIARGRDFAVYVINRAINRSNSQQL